MSSSSLGFGEPTHLKPLLPPIFGKKIQQIFELPPILIDFLMIQSSPKKNAITITNPPHLFEPGKKHGTQTIPNRPKQRRPPKPFDPRHSAKSEGLRRVSKTSGDVGNGWRRCVIKCEKWRIFVGFVGYVTIVYLGSIALFSFFAGVCFLCACMCWFILGS